MRKQGWALATLRAALLVSLFAGAVFAADSATRFFRPAPAKSPPPPPDRWSGTEYLVVFIGASTCAYAKDARVAEAIPKMVKRVRELATAEGARVATVGVATDVVAKDGIQYLATVAHFDEIMSGHGWLGIGPSHFAARALSGPFDTPQLLVLRRSVSLHPLPQISSDSLVVRLVGAERIHQHADRRFLPTFPPQK